MKLFVGLGNPGKEYENTRHNIGFKFIDFLANKNTLTFSNKFQSLYSEFQSNGEKVILLKPQTFMNNSGSAVQEVMKFYKLNSEDVYIIFDDLDIKEGEFKVQKAKYPKVHNGVNDIIQKTGTDKFNFVRIGIDGRNEIERDFVSGRDYVLRRESLNQYENIFKEIYTKVEILS